MACYQAAEGRGRPPLAIEPGGYGANAILQDDSLPPTGDAPLSPVWGMDRQEPSMDGEDEQGGDSRNHLSTPILAQSGKPTILPGSFTVN